ncbi:Rieske (2Fe-2S) protein [Actinoplanes sp. NPDC048791]|uniref:Rieske (2Fe-2S) protein n=1 Tax=Actinoplanes sp. NPDC048791 TaxID=3154623 RepID=UPI0033E0CFF3
MSIGARPADTEVRHVACAVTELPEGSMKALAVDGRRIIVVAVGNGEYTALADYCPHQRGPLSGGSVERMWVSDRVGEHERSPDTWVVICPFHNFETDVRTGCPVLPLGRSRAATYRTAVEDGQVVVYRRRGQRGRDS